MRGHKSESLFAIDDFVKFIASRFFQRVIHTMDNFIRNIASPCCIAAETLIQRGVEVERDSFCPIRKTTYQCLSVMPSDIGRIKNHVLTGVERREDSFVCFGKNILIAMYLRQIMNSRIPLERYLPRY